MRVAITETLNVKFIGVGDQNTKMVTNAEIYLGWFDFSAARNQVTDLSV